MNRQRILRAAFIDGASLSTIFQRFVLPLCIPALASFAIFRFLWAWNAYLVALIILRTDPNTRVVTLKLASIVGDRGQDWHLLTSGAFMSMIVPLIVALGLQRQSSAAFCPAQSRASTPMKSKDLRCRN